MKKLFIPPVLIAYSAIIMVLLSTFLPQLNLLKFPYNLSGVLIVVAGILYMKKPRDLFKKYNTTLKIEESANLVSEGVYSKTRNPIYLGMSMLILGFGICSMNVISLVLPFLFLLMVRVLHIPEEESNMLKIFGNEYLEYKKNVPRFL